MKSLEEFINESVKNSVEDLPKVETLGDGLFTGRLAGNCFTFEGKQYYSPIGILSIAPGPYYTFEIKEGKVIKHGDLNNMYDFSYDGPLACYHINESLEDYPNVLELGEGNFNGALWGHCFVFEDKKYYSESGWKNKFPMYCKMEIVEGKAWPHQVDIYQRQELINLYR